MSEERREDGDGVVELKFLVTAGVADQVLERARAAMQPDPHGGGTHGDWYQTSTLYFDTESCDTYHRRGSYARSKYRIRRYGSSDVLFLERKYKTRGLVSKRRSVVEVGDLHRLRSELDGVVAGTWEGRWFAERVVTRKLRNVCQINYDRTARVAMTSYGLVRLTLDESVSAAPVNSSEFLAAAEGVPVLSQRILEMKYRFAVPLLFKEIMRELALQPVAVSKYRLAAERLGIAAGGEAPCQTS